MMPLMRSFDEAIDEALRSNNSNDEVIYEALNSLLLMMRPFHETLI